MKDLTEREKLIIEFYEDGKIPTIIAIYDIWKKERIINGIRYISKLVKHRFNKLRSNGNDIVRTDIFNKKTNDERIRYD